MVIKQNACALNFKNRIVVYITNFVIVHGAIYQG
jgi:hypothetical protein